MLQFNSCNIFNIEKRKKKSKNFKHATLHIFHFLNQTLEKLGAQIQSVNKIWRLRKSASKLIRISRKKTHGKIQKG